MLQGAYPGPRCSVCERELPRAAPIALPLPPTPPPEEKAPAEIPRQRLDARWYPQLIINLTGPRLQLSMDHGPHRPAPKKATEESYVWVKQERHVTGYALVKEDMAFHVPKSRGSYETLEKGTVVELLEPTGAEAAELNRLAKDRKIYAVILWRGLSRYAPNTCVERVSDALWFEQLRLRRAPPQESVERES